MHDCACLGCLFLTQYGHGIGGSFAGMDDERLTHLARGSDMASKALLLPPHIPLGSVVIQSCFANRNHPGSPGKFNQLGHLRVVALAFIWVHAN